MLLVFSLIVIFNNINFYFSLKHCDFLMFMIQYLCHFSSNVVLNNI